MDYTVEQFEEILDKAYNEKRLSFHEFLIFVCGYGEVEFTHKGICYMIFRLNDDYSSGKDKKWDRSKDYFTFGEGFYAEEKPKPQQRYESIEELANKANINGRLIKDIWNEIEKVNTLD